MSNLTTRETEEHGLSEAMTAALNRLARQQGRGLHGGGEVVLDERTAGALARRGLAKRSSRDPEAYVVTPKGLGLVAEIKDERQQPRVENEETRPTATLPNQWAFASGEQTVRASAELYDNSERTGRKIAVLVSQPCDRPTDTDAAAKAQWERRVRDQLARAPMMEAALRVLVDCKRTREMLERVDPKALEQAREALGR